MRIDKNIATNVVGVIGVIAGAANPVLSATQGASLDTAGITQLILSICFGIVSFFTGRTQPQSITQ